MSFGKLYGFMGNARTTVLLVLAKENNLDIELVETIPDFGVSASYLKLNPLGLIPTFESPSGWVLTEAVAIAIYSAPLQICSGFHLPDIVASQSEDTSLLGQTKQDYAQILRWMSFINTEVQPPLAYWFKPLVGRRLYSEKIVEKARTTVNNAVAVLEAHLSTHRCLVGDKLSLADFFAVSSLSRGYQYVFDRQWQKAFPYVTQWFINVVNEPKWRAVVPETVLIDEAVKYSPSNVNKKTVDAAFYR